MNVEALLTAITYPSLANVHVEREIHGGRKRIDLTYDNVATTGFFRWISLHFPAAVIPVECKNYSKDIANEELDQLAGRFSPQRGKVGLLVSRQFANKDLFLRRCRDTAKEDRGWIIPLDDQDLLELAEEAEELKDFSRDVRLRFPLWVRRFEYLIS